MTVADSGNTSVAAPDIVPGLAGDPVIGDEPADALPADPDRLLFGMTPGDLVVIGVGVLFAVMFVPVTLFPSWTPRMSLLIAVFPAGMVALGVLVARRSRSGMAAAALLAWCLIASLFTDDIRGSIVGMVGRELSLVILGGSIGMWALGRQLTDRGREVLPWALIAGFGMSLLVGVLQIVLVIENGPLAAGSRATGLTPHPVYFGALTAAGAVLCASMLNRLRSPVLGLAAVGLFSVGVSLSGSRVALIATIVVVGYVMLRSHGGARLFLPGPLVVGTFVGSLVNGGASSGPSSDAASRLSSSTGTSERWNLWGYSLEAIRERPLQGWGLGRFRPAVQGRYTPDFAPQDVPGQAWFDAHNVVITSMVSVGVIGSVLATVFVVLAVRRVTGPLVLAAAVISITWLLQPTSLTTLPLVLLLLGAAAVKPDRPDPANAPWSGVPKLVWPLTAALGIILGGALLGGDVRIERSASPPDALALERSSATFLQDPSVADVVTQAWVFEVIAGGDHEADALRWAERAVEREPDRPRWWNRLARLQLAFGDFDAAKLSLDTVLGLQPWDIEAWELTGYYADEVGDPALAAEAEAAICAVQPSRCED